MSYNRLATLIGGCLLLLGVLLWYITMLEAAVCCCDIAVYYTPHKLIAREECTRSFSSTN